MICPRPVLVHVFARDIVFHQQAGGFPWRSQALWFLDQMRRAGQWASAQEEPARRIADQVFRPDLYRLAALDLGLPFPLLDHKTEGGHRASWTLTDATAPIAMGADQLIDGTLFDPLDPFPELPRHDQASAGDLR
jgi:nitrate/nitrite transport system substrate-binding protein